MTREGAEGGAQFAYWNKCGAIKESPCIHDGDSAEIPRLKLPSPRNYTSCVAVFRRSMKNR